MTPQKKKNLIMWALYALYFLLIMLLQNTIFGKFSIAKVHIILIPAAISCVAVFCGAEQGGIFALCASALWALSGIGAGGVWLLAMTVCAVIGGWLCDAFFHRRLASGMIVCFLSLAATLAAVLLVRMYLHGAAAGDFRLYLRQILIPIPLYPILYGLCRLIRKVGTAWTD